MIARRFRGYSKDNTKLKPVVTSQVWFLELGVLLSYVLCAVLVGKTDYATINVSNMSPGRGWLRLSYNAHAIGRCTILPLAYSFRETGAQQGGAKAATEPGAYKFGQRCGRISLALHQTV
jgi:hypothetical protein